MGIITMKPPRQNRRRLSPLRPMIPSIPWIAALRDICAAAQQFPPIPHFPHRQLAIVKRSLLGLSSRLPVSLPTLIAVLPWSKAQLISREGTAELGFSPLSL